MHPDSYFRGWVSFLSFLNHPFYGNSLLFWGEQLPFGSSNVPALTMTFGTLSKSGYRKLHALVR
jgi:hypothetical protein